MAILNGLIVNDTGSLTLPNGTSAQRPAYTVTVQSFTTVGTTSWTAPAGVTSVEVLVVAGGGGGGNRHAGGGGGSGVVYNSSLPVTPGASYVVTVGSGSAGATASNVTGSAGENSIFDTITALGGGAGVSDNGNPSGRHNGGSGGGAAYYANFPNGGTGIIGQGFYGGSTFFPGTAGAGGGGAGAPGKPNDGNNGGAGGSGVAYSISGSSVIYGAGGGGGSAPGSGIGGAAGTGGTGTGGSQSGSPSNGTANRGDGGGGTGGTVNGGNGGSGIVILKYVQDANNQTASGQTRFNSNLLSSETFNTNNEWTTASANKNIVINGLVAHLDASKYQTGSTWFDLTSQGANGTIYGAAFVAAGVQSYFSFNAANSDYISSTLSQNYVDCTIVFEPDFSRVGASNVASLLATGVSTDKSLRFVGVDGTGPWNTTGRNPGDNNDWAGGTPGGATNFYLNGELGQRLQRGWNIFGGSRTNEGASFTANFSYHLASGYPDRYFQGKIAVVLLYNRRLTSEEQRQNYAALAYRFGLRSVFSTSQSIPTDGLILNVDAADPNSYPGFGNIWYDQSSGNHMRLIGSPTYDFTGPKSFVFNGSDQYAICSTARNFPQKFGTIMGWANPVVNSGDHYIVCLGSANTGLARGIRLNAGTFGAIGYGSGQQDENGIETGTLGVWQHLAYVWRGTRNIEFYVNGKVYYAFKEIGLPGGSDITVGSNSFPPGGGLWNGRIASAQVYDKALTSNELQSVFQSQRQRFGV